jgi:DNA-binding beta-propeller fold protein YncE
MPITRAGFLKRTGDSAQDFDREIQWRTKGWAGQMSRVGSRDLQGLSSCQLLITRSKMIVASSASASRERSRHRRLLVYRSSLHHRVSGAKTHRPAGSFTHEPSGVSSGVRLHFSVAEPEDRCFARLRCLLKRNNSWKAIVLVAVFILSPTVAVTANQVPKPAARSRQSVPMFRVDPTWEKLPRKWVLGQVSAVCVDADNHIWVLHRPSTAKLESGRAAAPPVLEFDSEGSLMQAWGGPGKGYEWPNAEHGLFVDYHGYVWITGSGTDANAGNDQILKFAKDGTFILQIGHQGQGKGNTDRNNMEGPAAVSVYPKTGEVLVADGFFNRRVIVFDADTGAFKRMWGAFGNVPTDPPASTASDGEIDRAASAAAEDSKGPGPPQFSNVHCLKMSNDGLVYVCDKGNRRVQVFTTSGKYLEQAVGVSANSVAFSSDSRQKFMYVADRNTSQVLIFDRRTLGAIGAFGDGPGEAPGQFSRVHDLAVDSNGNIYTAEESDSPSNRRVQKFFLEKMSEARSK